MSMIIVPDNYTKTKNGEIYLGEFFHASIPQKSFYVFTPAKDTTRNCNAGDSSLDIVPEIRNLHGFDGVLCESSFDLWKGLRDGTLEGKWVLPPVEILSGRDLEENPVWSHSLWENRHKGDLKGTLRTRRKVSYSSVGRYATITQALVGEPYIRCVDLTNGKIIQTSSVIGSEDVRLCRFVEIPKRRDPETRGLGAQNLEA